MMIRSLPKSLTLQQFRGDDQLVSSTFANLKLTAKEIFAAGL